MCRNSVEEESVSSLSSHLCRTILNSPKLFRRAGRAPAPVPAPDYAPTQPGSPALQPRGPCVESAPNLAADFLSSPVSRYPIIFRALVNKRRTPYPVSCHFGIRLHYSAHPRIISRQLVRTGVDVWSAGRQPPARACCPAAPPPPSWSSARRPRPPSSHSRWAAASHLPA